MSILPLIKFGLGRWKIAVAGAYVIYSCGALEARWHLGCVLYSLTCHYVLADARACPTGVYDTKRQREETFIHINRNLSARSK